MIFVWIRKVYKPRLPQQFTIHLVNCWGRIEQVTSIQSAIYSFSFLAFLSEYSELDLVTSKVPLGPEVILEIH